LRQVTTEVPKVTKKRENFLEFRLPPFPGRADQPVGNQAEPEIDSGADINLKTMVARNGRKRGHQGKVRQIAQDDGDQGLKEVSQH
jgi:hypothetical protein